jgi:hypothetical protein
MEARAVIREAGIPRGLATLFALVVVLTLGLMLGYVAKVVSPPAAIQHPVATTTAPCCQAVGATEPVDSFDGGGHGFIP